ncbi:MAG: asparagine synthase (glutamine-hydrolyzing) [Marinifilaceae bacterium]|jgi:asparagine synthase (glutamine-hydrolysing)|nr:asparagine synthase (glutamine-hydrolyzing) [Marinifilaceae bacterium]
MCGIVGIYQNSINNESLVDRMLNIIEHRGPDEKSIFQYGKFTIGHRRLSIIDLQTGSQPIFNEDKSVCVILNGEIYNYKSIRKELEDKGHLFYTNTDTEILVHLYEEYKYDFINKLNGIFAFAILNMNDNSLMLARDHFGVKPLHYYNKDNTFIFGSEQKSILLHPSVDKEINIHALHSHLNLRYTQSEQTLFNGIQRLAPAHYAIYKNNNLSIHRYWELKPTIDNNIREDEAKEKLNNLLKQSIKRQLVSDVPVGVYLSGGLDSSAIVQKMHELGVENINTFTLGFNEPTDEFGDAKRIADYFGTNHRTQTLSMNPLEILPKVIWHAEEPKINLIQGFKMSSFVKPYASVVLGGLGGDELFAGYDIHKFIYPFNSLHSHIPYWLQKVMRLKSDILYKIQNASNTLRFDEYRRGMQMLLSIGNIEKFYLIMRNTWDYDKGAYKNIYSKDFINKNSIYNEKTYKEFENLFTKKNTKDALQDVLKAEFQSKMLNDYLLTNDRMSMAHSVEERVPFLDRDLVDFAFSLPSKLKIKNNTTKYLFRKAMEDKLPPKIISKKKWGFTVNPYLQFKKDLKEVAERELTPEFVKQQGIFNYKYIKKILDYPPHPKLRWHYNYIWIAVGLAMWQKMFIDSNDFSKHI